MPDDNCWREIGALRAEVNRLVEANDKAYERIERLEEERAKVKAIGGFVALIFTGLGMVFSDSIKSLGDKLLR
jgi:hypothetical protein